MQQYIHAIACRIVVGLQITLPAKFHALYHHLAAGNEQVSGRVNLIWSGAGRILEHKYLSPRVIQIFETCLHGHSTTISFGR